MWAGNTSPGVRRLEEFRCRGGGGRGVGAVQQKSWEHQVGKRYAKRQGYKFNNIGYWKPVNVFKHG